MFVFTLLYCLITCWERGDPLALLCVMLPCAFVIFPYGVLGKVSYLIVLIPGLFILLYFRILTNVFT